MQRGQSISILAIILFTFTSCHSNKDNTPKITDEAMVVTAHPIASKVGKRILQKGGNAVDAAIAVQFALAVVYPVAGNIGGGGFMVTKMDSTYSTLDFRETAPLKATPTLFQDSLGNPLPEKSLKGHLASGVPGTVAGMIKAHKKWGSLPLSKLIIPSIELARKGFSINNTQAERFNEFLPEFQAYSTFAPKPFQRNYPWKKGDTLIQKSLAQTLTRIKNQGRAGFYKGKTAQYIINEMERCNGIISHTDLQKYEAKFRAPIKGDFRNYEVITMPPPSSGGICLIQLLKIVSGYPLKEWGFHESKTVHLMVEAEKRVYADRSKHIGDPAYYNVPREALLDSAYLNERMESFSMSEATPSSQISPGSINYKIKGQTTHFSIVDEERNAVSVTTTLNTEYGSKVFVGQAGFFLNSEMNDFSIKPGYPNTYGLIGGKANKIEPGKRMLSSMTPTIVEKNGSLYAVLGSPGGSTIITSVFQTLLNITVFDMNMQKAVNMGRFHHQWKPDYILTEYNRPLPASTIWDLYLKGHWVIPFPTIGSVDAIRVNNKGKLEGGADPRGNDKAMGY